MNVTIEGNNDAQPAPQDQEQPQSQDQRQPGVTITAIEEVTDPDEIELREALKAAQAEEAAAKGEPGNEPSAGAAPQEPSQGGQKPPTQADAPMIPKPRLDEALAKAARAEQEAAYWRGRAEQGQPGQHPGNQPPPAPEPSPEQKLAQVHQQIDALAEKFDAGEISMKDFTVQQRALAAQEQAIREEAMLARVQPAAPGGDSALYLDTLTADLERQNPWVLIFDAVGTDAEWAFLKQRAIENLVGRGVDPTNGTVGRYELRKEMASLATDIGPALVGKRAQEKGITLPSGHSPKPQPGQPQPLSAKAQALDKKLEMAANAPPNLSAMGGAHGANAGQVTAAQIETMSDEEIAALPEAVRERILLGTAA